MSSLNSSPDPDLIRKLAFGERPTAAEMHATGVDIEVLEAVYAIVKPELKFFPGDIFTTLEKSFSEQNTRMSRRFWTTWLSAFPRADTFDQVVMLLRTSLMSAEGSLVGVWNSLEPSDGYELDYFAELRIYLRKQGEWLVWTNCPKSRFEVCQTPRQAIDIANSMLPEGGEFESTFGSLSLEIAPMLDYAYGRYVRERESRLHRSREDYERIKRLTGSF